VRSSATGIVRTTLIVVAVVVVLYVAYLLRRPIGWLLIATFIALALSPPVGFLSRRIRRGFAIAIVYIGLLLVPIGLGVVVVPPVVTQVQHLVDNAPRYAADVRDFIERNRTLRYLQEEYDIGGQLQRKAAELPGKVGSATSVLAKIGLGLVNSIFALVTILILAAFMLAGGPRWRDGVLRLLPADRAMAWRRVTDEIATAVGNYVAGALAQAVIAGTTSYVVMVILGVPFAGPLAVLIGVFDVIPLVGATIAAIIVGIVTLFVDFPTATIIWAIWAIVYQQVENNILQPRIQSRAVDVQPFVVLVAVLFGSTLSASSARSWPCRSQHLHKSSFATCFATARRTHARAHRAKQSMTGRQDTNRQRARSRPGHGPPGQLNTRMDFFSRADLRDVSWPVCLRAVPWTGRLRSCSRRGPACSSGSRHRDQSAA
jgi:predicted PurR-regulated permease PerM